MWQSGGRQVAAKPGDNRMTRIWILLIALLAYATLPAGRLHAQETPEVGKKAPDFSLESVRGDKVQLSKLVGKGPVVLIVLRGYPGYQCPICSRQVGELLQQADKIAEHGTQVVFVYPGPGGQLKERAKEFLADRTIPKHFHLVMDPDYTFTDAYRLRWNAPRETAYPSTFVIDRKGVIRFAKVSKTHGGRAAAKEVLKELAELAKSNLLSS
jgi:thioredoxin-dependent peroxiredoxin